MKREKTTSTVMKVYQAKCLINKDNFIMRLAKLFIGAPVALLSNNLNTLTDGRGARGGVFFII